MQIAAILQTQSITAEYVSEIIIRHKNVFIIIEDKQLGVPYVKSKVTQPENATITEIIEVITIIQEEEIDFKKDRQVHNTETSREEDIIIMIDNSFFGWERIEYQLVEEDSITNMEMKEHITIRDIREVTSDKLEDEISMSIIMEETAEDMVDDSTTKYNRTKINKGREEEENKEELQEGKREKGENTKKQKKIYKKTIKKYEQ
ncbi:hypothetical protein C1645_738146 [Glomus cerebriforme]|uniref:Uncharacterized protein n=1 Tax=Glomus cerebriforme TaxID=658196 RepID=A0A397T4I5_9GLOM|nr:hypothetical protein C1645_738146 [Glomus cerebriforme]